MCSLVWVAPYFSRTPQLRHSWIKGIFFGAIVNVRFTSHYKVVKLQLPILISESIHYVNDVNYLGMWVIVFEKIVSNRGLVGFCYILLVLSCHCLSEFFSCKKKYRKLPCRRVLGNMKFAFFPTNLVFLCFSSFTVRRFPIQNQL